MLQSNWDFLKKMHPQTADWWVHIIKDRSGVHPLKGHLSALLSHGPTLERVTPLVRVTQPMHIHPLFQIKGTSAVFSIVNRGHDGGLIGSVQLNVCFMGPDYCIPWCWTMGQQSESVVSVRQWAFRPLLRDLAAELLVSFSTHFFPKKIIRQFIVDNDYPWFGRNFLLTKAPLHL